MTPPEDAISQDEAMPPGTVIAGNFRVEDLIGSGAMGNVYRAQQLSLGKAVAVKVLHPRLVTDEKLVRRFQREAKSASRLNHPNSIQIIDSGRDNAGTLYIAMELLAGRDLAQIIRDEFPLPVPRVVHIMSQVLSALDEAHTQGVIHRDLKPSNIMLIERRGQPDFVKVCDYGIAKAQVDDDEPETQMLTVQGLVCGTPEYMSPEQARGEPLDGRADLYSASVILYHMVTGDIPFRAATPIGIVSRHLSEAPVVPSSRRADPDIPAELDDLILRGLAKARELRPATALVFRQELEDVGAGRMVRRIRAAENTIPATEVPSGVAQTTRMAAAAAAMAPAPGAPEPSRRQPPVRRAMVGASLAAAILVAAVVLLGRSGTEPPPSQTGVQAAGLAGAAPRASSPGGDAPWVGARAAAVPAPEPRPSSPPGGEPAAALVAQAADDAAPASSRTWAASTRRSDDVAVPVKGGPAPTRRTREAGRRQNPQPPMGARGSATSSTGAVPTSVNGPSPPTAGAAAGGVMLGVAAPVPSGAIPGPGSASAEKPASGSHAPREAIVEAESLLSRGEVVDACRRGEEAKNAAPRSPPVYKFLGKCYMRAGNPTRAKENYRRYLELNPTAPDAMFIESIVK